MSISSFWSCIFCDGAQSPRSDNFKSCDRFDLSSNTIQAQMDFPAIFVAMSRVKNKNHLRLLGQKNEKKQEKNHQEAHLHMTKLRPSTFVTSFYAGCTEKNLICLLQNKPFQVTFGMEKKHWTSKIWLIKKFHCICMLFCGKSNSKNFKLISHAQKLLMIEHKTYYV